MDNQRFKLYYIDEQYINYLRTFDNKVPFNKNQTRPYIGIVYTYNNINYFAPLSSPKPKHLNMNPKAFDIYKIDNGKLGIININNMIPTPLNCLTEVLPLIKDKNYKTLLENQITFINTKSNSLALIEKINYFQKQYRSNHLAPKILDRTCNFSLLEEKCNEWIDLSINETLPEETNTEDEAEDEDEPEM